MNPRQHLDPSTLISHAAGALPMAMAVVAATHLEGCAHCRANLGKAERIGGMLLEQQQPQPADASHAASRRAAMRQRLSDPGAAITMPMQHAAGDPDAVRDPDKLPAPLHPYFGNSYKALKWRWLAPGVHAIRAPDTHTLLLLKIAPGKCMPVHSHHGNELTHVLQGAYHDALGHFATGDVADLDNETLHQPVTLPGVPCICVSALDAPLRFPGWLARALQPLFKL